jgi:hypothetical protein
VDIRLVLPVVACLFLVACDASRKDAPQGGKTIQVVLEGVTLRQYRGGALLFEFEAPRVELDEEDGILRAFDGVSGQFAPAIFQERPR